MIRDQYVSLQGPVERRGDQLVLRVPLDEGGERLKQIASAASYVENGDLVVILPDWLAQRMELQEGAAIHVDDRWGKLNVSRLQ